MTELFRSEGWRFNPWAVLPLISAVGCALLAWLIWSRRPRRATFAPIAIVAAAWNVIVCLVMCRDVDDGALFLSRLAVSAIACVGPFAVAFALTFVRLSRRRLPVALAWAVTSVSVAAIGLDDQVIVGVREPWWGGRYPIGGPRFLLCIGVILAVLAFAIVLLVRAFRRTPPSRLRRQIGYVALAYGVAALGGVDALGVMGAPFFPMGWCFCLLSVATIGYAMARWRLMDIRTAVHRTIIGALAAFATLVPLGAFTALAEGWAGWRKPAPRAVAIVSSVSLVALYMGRVGVTLRSVIDRRRRRHTALLERFVEKTAFCRRPAEVLEPLRILLAEGADLELRAVALAIDVGEGPPATYAVLPEDAPAAPYSPGRRLPDEPVSRAELDPEALGEANREHAEQIVVDRIVARWLSVYGAHVLVPLRHGGIDVGAILAAAPRADVTLDEAARDRLSRIGGRASVAFVNACLYDDLERRAASLEREVAERTRELARAVEELKMAQASLVQAEKQSSVGLLVAGVSHEINNALNFMYGNLPTLATYAETYDELLARAESAGAALPEEVRHAVERARAALPIAIGEATDAVRRARSIVDDLRRFARRDEAERKMTDVREGLDSTVNLLRAELGDRIAIERCYDHDVPAVDCFPAALNHVFLNVLINAAQAIPDRGRIRIVCKRGPDGGVVVEFIDDGCGVPAADRERVFEPFVTTRPRAAGLGLAVSRQIVERHAGSITLEAGPEGRGTCVRIAIPPRAPQAQGHGRIAAEG